MKSVLQILIQSLNAYDFVIAFTPSIPFNKIKIVTRFGIVNSCYVQSGLRVKSLTSAITCKSISNMIEISNFQTFEKTGRTLTDQVRVGLNAKTIVLSGKTQPIEIYTFLDDNYLVKAQASTTSADTVVTITVAPPIQINTLLQLSSYQVDTFVTITGDVVPLNGYAAGTNLLLRFVFPSLFQIGKSVVEGPVCDFTSYYQYEIGMTILDKTDQDTVGCDLNTSSPYMLEFELESLTMPFPLLAVDSLKPYLTVKNSLSITNIKTPKLAGSYDIDLYLHYKNSEILLEYYRLVVNIVPASFSYTPTINSINFGDRTLFKVMFTSPIELNPSNQNIENYFGKFSKIFVKFPQVKSAQPLWQKDLGYTQQDSYDQIDCWNGLALDTYSPGLECLLVLGRDPALYTLSSTDYASIVVKNYKKVASGNSVEFSFFVKYPSLALATTVIVEIYESNVGKELLLLSATASTPLPVAPPSPVPSLSGLLASSSKLLADEYTDITITFSTATNYVISDAAMINVELPIGWKYSTALSTQSQVTIDGFQLFYPNVVFDSFQDLITVALNIDLPAGEQEFKVTSILIPPGSSAANNIRASLYLNKIIAFRGQKNLGPITCFSIPNILLTTDIRRNWAPGATYSFSWVSSKPYTNPTIELTVPSPAYTFSVGTDYTAEALINGVVFDGDLLTATFTGSTVTISIPNVFLIDSGVSEISH